MITISGKEKTGVTEISYTEQIITREQVKTYLQISDATKDAIIDAFLVPVEQNVQHITHNSWDLETTATTTNTSDTLTEVSSSILDYVQVNNLVKIESQDIERAVIIAIDKTAQTIQLDTVLTTTEENADIIINTFPEAYKFTVARMINHNINVNNSEVAPGEVEGETIGSYSYRLGSGGTELDGYGYPKVLSNGLKKITRPRYK